MWDKSGLTDFARFLTGDGYEIVSTGGTATHLQEAGIDVISVESITGQGALMDGRLKTLDMRLFGPILFDRAQPGHVRDLQALGQPPIDMVVVNLYPFEAMLAGGKSREEMIEYIDVGGPSLLRAAAKNHRHVMVVSQPGQYELVRGLIEQHGDDIPPGERESLAGEVFALTARYDSLIAAHFRGTSDLLPEALHIEAQLQERLRYGENPHQAAGFYLPAGHSVPWKQLHGKALSYNNYADIDAAWAMVSGFDEPAVAIVKHANPCGFGLGLGPREAYLRALATDRESSFGGIVAFNRPVDAAAAKPLTEGFLECIIAPHFEPGAVKLLTGKKNVRLLEATGVPAGKALEIKGVAGGYLAQEADSDQGETGWTVATRRQPTAAEMQALRLCWKLVRFVKSNAIVFGNHEQLLGIGAGQMSRIDSVRLAGVKAAQAKLDLAGASMASDAFFPFPDGVERAANLGVTSVIQPGGSIRDEEVIALANERGLAMVLTHSRHFRH